MSSAPKNYELYDALAAKLQTHEMYGQVLASWFMFAELLPTLVRAGVLTKQQVETAIDQASTNLAASINAEIDPAASATIMKSAESALAGLRKSLHDVSLGT